MVLLTQHYDTVTHVGSQSKATVMMIPYTPTGMSNVGDQIMQALLAKDAMLEDKQASAARKSDAEAPA
jgi:hypothetical protein